VLQLPTTVAAPAAAFVAFSALSLLWSHDLGAGRQLLEFFLLPLAALVAVVARAGFPSWMPRALAVIAVGLASVFATLALWQAATHKLLFYAPTLQVANVYAPYFRVTSLFRDPSLYGRHVVLGLVIVVVLLWLRRLAIVPALLLMALLWSGLLFSYSQSSFAALFVAALAVSLAAADRRSRRIVAVGAGVIVLAGASVTAATAVHHSSGNVTSDRSRRVTLTARVWEHHPLVGVGLGGQPAATQAIADRRGALPHFVSHTTPLTVLAELGVIGFAVYLAFAVGVVRLLLQVYRRRRDLGLILGGVLLALFVHSLAYSGFFEDPITWFTIGVAAAAVIAARPSAGIRGTA
jgi:O-antigen ligase